MAKKELTEQQQNFINALFDNGGSVDKALVAAGYSLGYSHRIIRTLKEEILEQAEYILALNAPRAVHALVDGVDRDNPVPVSPIRVQCAKEILDRVGVIKKEKVEITGIDSPIFWMPNKDPVTPETEG